MRQYDDDGRDTYRLMGLESGMSDGRSVLFVGRFHDQADSQLQRHRHSQTHVQPTGLHAPFILYHVKPR
jgi:hypothetical protein